MKKEKLIKKGVLFGVGVAAYIQEKTEKFARNLVKKGYLDRQEGKKLVKNIYSEANASRKRLAQLVEKEMKNLVKKIPKVPKKIVVRTKLARKKKIVKKKKR